MHLFDCLVRRVVRWSSGFKCLLKLVQPFLKSCHYHRPLSQTVCSYSPLFLIRLPVPPNVHRCESCLARIEISIYAPYVKERLNSASTFNLYLERIVGKPEVVKPDSFMMSATATFSIPCNLHSSAITEWKQATPIAAH